MINVVFSKQSGKSCSARLHNRQNLTLNIVFSYFTNWWTLAVWPELHVLSP